MDRPAGESRAARLPRVLFVCTGASCRSQMAGGWASHLADGAIETFSAGTRPKGLHPFAIRAMREVGIDIARRPSASVFDFLTDAPDVVVSVCSEAARDCPEFPATVPTLRWSFEDPAAAQGPDDQVLAIFRRVRDEIGERVRAWLAEADWLAGSEALSGRSRRR